MNAENLNFERTGSVVSVTELRGQFPNLPPRILVTLAVMTFLARTVTPFRLCQCGCGESVHGKARLASPACRQRVSREARAIRATAPKQFNLVLQHEIPVPIPFSPKPRDHGSAQFVVCWRSGHTPPKTLYICDHDFGDGDIGWGCTEQKTQAKRFATKEAALTFWRGTHAWPEDYEHCLTDGTTWVEEADLIPPHEPATRASHTSQPHEPATRARTDL